MQQKPPTEIWYLCPSVMRLCPLNQWTSEVGSLESEQVKETLWPWLHLFDVSAEVNCGAMSVNFRRRDDAGTDDVSSGRELMLDRRGVYACL